MKHHENAAYRMALQLQQQQRHHHGPNKVIYGRQSLWTTTTNILECRAKLRQLVIALLFIASSLRCHVTHDAGMAMSGHGGLYDPAVQTLWLVTEMPLAPSLCSLANGYGFHRAFAAEALCRSMLEGHLGLVYGEKSLGAMC